MNEGVELDALVVSLAVEELGALRLKLHGITMIIELKAHLHRAIVITPLKSQFLKLYEFYYYIAKISLTLP